MCDCPYLYAWMEVLLIFLVHNHDYMHLCTLKLLTSLFTLFSDVTSMTSMKSTNKQHSIFLMYRAAGQRNEKGKPSLSTRCMVEVSAVTLFTFVAWHVVEHLFNRLIGKLVQHERCSSALLVPLHYLTTCHRCSHSHLSAPSFLTQPSFLFQYLTILPSSLGSQVYEPFCCFLIHARKSYPPLQLTLPQQGQLPFQARKHYALLPVFFTSIHSFIFPLSCCTAVLIECCQFIV